MIVHPFTLELWGMIRCSSERARGAARCPGGTTLGTLLCCEERLVAETDDYVWPSFDERTASSICCTSGTTESCTPIRPSEFTFDPFQDERLPPRCQVCRIAERPPGAPGYGP